MGGCAPSRARGGPDARRRRTRISTGNRSLSTTSTPRPGRRAAGRSARPTGSTCEHGWPGSPVTAMSRLPSRGAPGGGMWPRQPAAAGIAVHLAESADTAFARGRKRFGRGDVLRSRPLVTGDSARGGGRTADLGPCRPGPTPAEPPPRQRYREDCSGNGTRRETEGEPEPGNGRRNKPENAGRREARGRRAKGKNPAGKRETGGKPAGEPEDVR